MTHKEILMQSHFLSDAFFDSLRSVRFTDRSIIYGNIFVFTSLTVT
ncbi:MAG: hypothetical protein LBR79_00470 [Oscillospiraceae bacterium]|nr:hypothetical protein [Oscillospiraceae bacterium]